LIESYQCRTKRGSLGGSIQAIPQLYRCIGNCGRKLIEA
jgi:hypothetical protein